ncbi:MAG: hypothetical protein QF449_15610, partial [Alphaproteobacteria bacterium]|nr:hypothetical protein [Alphaproteobacteria bacterium]
NLSEPVAALVFEGLIRYNSGSPILLTELQRHPSIFGFEITLSSEKLRTCTNFDISNQGLDSELIGLRIGIERVN